MGQIGNSGFNLAMQKAFLESIGENQNNFSYDLCKGRGAEAKQSEKVVSADTYQRVFFIFETSSNMIGKENQKRLKRKKGKNNK